MTEYITTKRILHYDRFDPNQEGIQVLLVDTSCEPHYLVRTYKNPREICSEIDLEDRHATLSFKAARKMYEFLKIEEDSGKKLDSLV